MMSRLSATWVFLWAVLACIGLLIWQAVRDKDKNDPNPSAVEAGGDGSSAKLASGKGTLGEQGRPRQSKGNLMAKLKDPENPPEGLEDEAKRKWLDDYIAKIDDASYLDDEESLLLLIVEYGNPNLEISEAAYSSLMARHDKAALFLLGPLIGQMVRQVCPDGGRITRRYRLDHVQFQR